MHRSAPQPQHAGLNLCLGLPDQGKVVGRDQHRLSQFVQLNQKLQQPGRHLPVDITRGLVRQDQIRRHHDGAGQGRPLALATRQFRRTRRRPLGQTDPAYKIGYVLALRFRTATGNRRGQGDVFRHRKMIKELTILMHDPYPLTQLGHAVPVQLGGILPKNLDPPALRCKLQIAELQEGGLAASRRAGEKVKRAWRQFQGKIGKQGPIPVTVADFREFDHIPPLAARPAASRDIFASAHAVFQSRIGLIPLRFPERLLRLSSMRQEMSGEMPGRVGLMRLICPNCDAQYEVDAAMIPASGRDVQCSNCGKTWFQGGDSPETETVPAKENPSGDGLTDEARQFFSQDDTEEPDSELVSEPGPDADVPGPDDRQQDPWKSGLEDEADDAVVAETTADDAPEDDTARAASEQVDAPVADQPDPGDAAPEDKAPEQADPEQADAPAAGASPTAQPGDTEDDAGEDTRASADEDDSDGDEDGPRPDLKRPDIDSAVLGILKAEADREMAARRAEEAAGVESQPDLGLSDPEPAEDDDGAISARTARLRGSGSEGDQAGARKTILPDVDEINSTLTATSDRVSADSSAAEAAQQVQKRRSGFRMGFAVLMLATAVAILLYLYAPQLGSLVPALEPALAGYVDWANGVRISIDGFLERSVESLTGLLVSISS